MKKTFIKSKLRESLNLISEKEGEESNGRSIKKDYSDIQNSMGRDLSPTQVGLMKTALGIEDDKNGVNRSLFHKKLFQDKNEDGSYYQFNDEELASLRAALNIR